VNSSLYHLSINDATILSKELGTVFINRLSLLACELEDACEILVVSAGFGTEKSGVSYLSRKVTEFITSAGPGFVNDTFFKRLGHDS
jgi:hypothetical protein